MERPQFMPFQWQADYACQVERIDSYRQKVLDIANQMVAQYNARRCKDNITEPFFKLAFCLENFFAEVEMLLRQLSYPYLHQQKEAHRLVLVRLVQFKDDFTNQSPTVCIDMLQFMTQWIESDILHYNPNIVRFLKSKGVA